MEKRERYIVHVDMDAFFASVEQRDNPSYKGKPVIVGADPAGGKGRGVVCAASYEARRFGVRSAQPISRAYANCPGGVFLRPDMDKYVAESHKIFSVLLGFTPNIEPISIDEAFMDITGSYHLWRSPEATCRKIKTEIRSRTGLTASLGMAPNKTAAKIASDIKKPDGLMMIDRRSLQGFLSELPADKLWGVGKKTLAELHNNGLYRIGDIALSTPERLTGIFGKNGRKLWELANGIDERDVSMDGPGAVSIGHEHTFSTDTKDREKILDALMVLSEKVSYRLRRDMLEARTITLKLRLASFETYTRSAALPEPSSHVEDIYKAVTVKLDSFDLRNDPVRLVGIRSSGLESCVGQNDLFHGLSPEHQRRERIHTAIEKLVDKYGPSAIRRRSAR